MLEEYYFLFFAALLWIIFATIQDLRTREVSNWLNFSLVAIALAYRGFYSVFVGDYSFLLFGLLGFGLFFVLGNVFYYTKVFAGGDAKLLMGIGAVLPFESYSDLAVVSLSFIFILFLIGAAYSVIYTVFLVYRNTGKFKKEFNKYLFSCKNLFVLSFLFSGILLIFLQSGLWIFIAVFLFLVPLLYIYLLALEKSCMIKLVDANKLTEGDWLENDIKVGGHIIRKSVHGLSLREIEKLRKTGKKVLIKEGIPFVPAFLASFLIMGFFFLILGSLDFVSFLLSLF